MASPYPSCDNKTEVIIVGNGPSAIALSFMLSGWRPYYNGSTLSNEYLMKRLEEGMGESLLDKDLEPLCEGLEGRSNNPVALLFDHLTHPDADLGEDNPSVLDWVYEPDLAIPHVVLGTNRPGGTWQKIDGSMQTISQSSWMELPTMPFQKWLEASDRMSETIDLNSTRATIKDVKDYYTQFVKLRDLEKNFRDFCTVTSVQNIFLTKNNVDDESGEVEPCCRNIRRNHTHCWEVRGYKTITKEDDDEDSMGRQDFTLLAPYVVAATGTYDIPNRLEVDGENLPSVVHSLGQFEGKISSGEVTSASEPVVVVGAGLSAADCILTALQNDIPIIHVFRRGPFDPSLIFSKLPSAIYPEYHHIHSLMKGKAVHELYRPLPRHNVVELMPGKILVQKQKKPLSSAKEPNIVDHFDISMAAIMIGSKSDLGFLPSEGRSLGMVPKWPVDSKHNVVDVDPYSYQSNHQPQLFAMGPLVGDNFVRFGIGGALGIVNHLNKCRCGRETNFSDL